MSDPDDVVWYISRDGQRIGPLTAEEFGQFEETDRLRPTDQIWQTGMPGWVAYRDYDMRAAAARFANPARSSSPPKSSRLHAITNTLKGAFRGVSRRLAEIRTAPSQEHGGDDEVTRAPEATPSISARLSPDALKAIPAAPVRTQEPSLRALVGTLLQADDGETRQPTDQERNRRAPADTTEHVAEPLRPSSPIPTAASEARDTGMRRFAATQLQRPGGDTPKPSEQHQNRRVPADTIDDTGAHVGEPGRHSMAIPRLASEVQAAAQIGLDLTTFRRWVADGRLPRALPDCGKYDLKAIHLALDRMSNIASPENGPDPRLHRPRRDKD